MEDSSFSDLGSYYWSKPLLEGFLLKKGKGINLGLKKRWFVLSEGRMYYYKSSDAIRGTELGYIDLTTEYKLVHNPSDPCHFRINTPQRIWYLTAEAEEECRFWVEGITAYQIRQKNRESQRFTRNSWRPEDDDDSEDLKALLEDAEMVIEANKNHVDELYKDLQNSIQIIKLKNEQIDLLATRLAEYEGRSAQEQTPEMQPLTPQNALDIHPFDPDPEESPKWNVSVSYDDKWRRSSFDEKRFRSPKQIRVAQGRESKRSTVHPSIREEKKETLEHKTEEDLLAFLENSMESFLEYLAGDEHGKSSRIAISVWMKTIETYRKQQQEKQSKTKDAEENPPE